MPAPLQNINSTLLRRLPTVLVDESHISAPAPSTLQQFVGRTTENINTSIPNVFVNLQQSDEDNDADEEGEEEEATQEEAAQADRFITNALLSLLNLPPTALTRNYISPLVPSRAMEQFLQPVVVHPTAEQIAENTTLGNLVSDTDHACAICQDSLTAEQEGRKLNACGHWFHKSCIDTWLERDVHCPVCRHDIREPLTITTPPTQ